MDYFVLSAGGAALALMALSAFLFQKLAKAQAVAEGCKLAVAERNELRAKLDEAISARHEAEKQVELANQKMADLNTRMKDWETQREESVRAAKAAILEAGGQMSSKLLEDHKREQEAHKKEQQQFLTDTTGNLMQQFTQVAQVVAGLKEDNAKTSKQMQTVWRSLTSPSSAGQLAEFGLENALKNLGLEPGRDFIMQYSVPGQGGEGRLRPDAVVFLPGGMVMVVDCKASKFLLELAEAEGTGQEAHYREKLVQTMQKHMRDLASKDYSSAVQDAFRAQGHTGKIGTLLNIMYLPSESAWEKLRQYDPECQTRLEKSGLIPASPATLMGLFSLASLNIAEERKLSNHHLIVDGTANLLESVSVMMGYMDKVGKGISTAMDAFNNAAKSANTRMIPRMKTLTGMGIKPARNKELPKPVMTYDLRRLDDMTMIEGEAETLADTPQLPQPEKTAEPAES